MTEWNVIITLVFDFYFKNTFFLVCYCNLVSFYFCFGFWRKVWFGGLFYFEFTTFCVCSTAWVLFESTPLSISSFDVSNAATSLSAAEYFVHSFLSDGVQSSNSFISGGMPESWYESRYPDSLFISSSLDNAELKNSSIPRFLITVWVGLNVDDQI